MEKLELSEQYENIEEIPDYGFSGREDLEEITLPRSVRRIGRYAFYNCRNLRRITFYSHIQDVGSGAFTGCHQVRHLDVTIVTGKPSCLKDFLQELTEEMTVDYRVETLQEQSPEGESDRKNNGLQMQEFTREYARLMFPEYYEEGVENTPARILMTQIHGSGLKYRNCFYRTEFQFEEYDIRFPYAEAVESPEFLQEMVLGRLMYPLRLNDKGRERYEKYLKEHLTDIGKRLIQGNDVPRLVWLAQNYLETESQAEVLLSEAGRRGAAECTGCLMEWRRRKFGAQSQPKSGIPDFEF